MIIYNKTWLNNLQLHQLFEEEHEAGCLTDNEFKALKEKYPVGFYMPGIIIRIGLFILTFIIVFFSAGLLSLFLANEHIIDGFGWPMFLGIVGYSILELMVKGKHYYQSGVDEALLWISAGLLTGGFTWMLYYFSGNNYISYSALSMFIFVLSTFLTLRFADLLMAVIACLSCQAIVFFNWIKLETFGMATLPFIMMLTSALMYFLVSRSSINLKNTYYTNCINIAKLVSLVTLYLSGNYFVVNELSNVLNKGALGGNLPFGLIFWVWTLLLPFAYICWGVKKKDKIWLRTGLFLIAMAVFTFRYYYHILPVETAFTLGGAALLLISYAIIKYLKTPRNGFTYAELKRKALFDQLNIESLVVGETFAQNPTPPSGPDSPFGGGSAGGGGSSSTY